MIELVRSSKSLTLNPLYQKMSDSELDKYYQDLLAKQKENYETEISELNTEIDELEAELETAAPDSVFLELASGGDYTVFHNENLTTAKNYLFANTLYRGIELPNLRVARAQSFYYMTNCLYIDVPNLETLEGGSHFMYDTQLTSISLPKIKKATSQLFYNCSSLKSIYLPALEDVSAATFCFQGVLATRIDLPATMTSKIPTYFCNKASNLETFILRSNTLCALAGTNAFTQTPIASGTGYIYVPAALIEDYKVATNWITYAAQFRAIEDYLDICGEEVSA